MVRLTVATTTLAAALGCASSSSAVAKPATRTADASGGYHDPDHRRGALPDADHRRAVLAAIRSDLDAVYAHRLDKEQRYHLDESALFAAADARLQAATTWAAYDAALYDLLSQFHDGHLSYHPPLTAAPVVGWAHYQLGLDTALVGDHLIVARVEPGAAVAVAGVVPGDEVVRIDHRPVADLLAHEVVRRAWSRPESARASWVRTWTRTDYANGQAPRQWTVSFARRRDGAVVDVAITPIVLPAQHRAAATATTAGDLVTLEVHSLGGGRSAIAELDAALATARAAHQLIIDLRGVRGGVDRVGYRLVTGLAEGKPSMGTVRVLLADQTRAARKMWRDLPADADGWSQPIALVEDGQAAGAGFHGKLAVVVDATCASTCEVVAAALRGNLHAVVVGETTAGNSGAPIELALPGGGDIAIPTWKLTAADGKPIEDDGVVPDVVAPPTVDALAAGSDAAMDAARSYCTSQKP